MTFIIALTMLFGDLFSLFLLGDCELLEARAGVLFAVLRLSAVSRIPRALWVPSEQRNEVKREPNTLDHEAFSSSRETWESGGRGTVVNLGNKHSQ